MSSEKPDPDQSSLIQPSCWVRNTSLSSFFSPVQYDPVLVLWFLKQLEVQPDNYLSCGNLMEQQSLRDWSFRALVLLYFSQPDLCPAQEVWGERVKVCEKKRPFIPS